MLFLIGYILFALPIMLLFPTKVIGRQNLKFSKQQKKGYIICANHYSNMDVIVLDVNLAKKIYYMTKKELFKSKFQGWLLKRLGGIPVDRSAADVAAYRQAMKTLKDKKILGIFPEGTRNKQDAAEMTEIKSGAIVFASKSGCPIVPVAIYRKPKLFRKNYILVGEPFNPVGENPLKLTKAEIEENTDKLTIIMNDLHNQLTQKYQRHKK